MNGPEGKRWHFIVRACSTVSCAQRGEEYTSIYTGPASSHPSGWPTANCGACGRVMCPMRVGAILPDSPLAKALTEAVFHGIGLQPDAEVVAPAERRHRGHR